MIFKLLNVPNFYCTYYLEVLSNLSKISYDDSSEFSKYDFSPLIIFKVNNKLIVIDNNDPIGLDSTLYEKVDYYFATNKLIGHPDYSQEKVFPLFPHYPINIRSHFFRIFAFKLPLKKYFRFFLEIYRINKRPFYSDIKVKKNSRNFVFFSGSIWEKERNANMARADFMKYCKESEYVEFEGGFISRKDGKNQGFDKYLNLKSYSPKKFTKLSSESVLGFNNPAVLGAVSWRFAEYLNMGVSVVSLPFKIELPISPKHRSEIYLIKDTNFLSDELDQILSDSSALNDLSFGGKKYFLDYCTIEKQADYLGKFIF
jgi:hypothetical protein